MKLINFPINKKVNYKWVTFYVILPSIMILFSFLNQGLYDALIDLFIKRISSVCKISQKLWWVLEAKNIN